MLVADCGPLSVFKIKKINKYASVGVSRVKINRFNGLSSGSVERFCVQRKKTN